MVRGTAEGRHPINPQKLHPVRKPVVVDVLIDPLIAMWMQERRCEGEDLRLGGRRRERGEALSRLEKRGWLCGLSSAVHYMAQSV